MRAAVVIGGLLSLVVLAKLLGTCERSSHTTMLGSRGRALSFPTQGFLCMCELKGEPSDRTRFSQNLEMLVLLFSVVLSQILYVSALILPCFVWYSKI